MENNTQQRRKTQTAAVEFVQGFFPHTRAYRVCRSQFIMTLHDSSVNRSYESDLFSELVN